MAGPKFVEQGEEYASAIDFGVEIKSLTIKDGVAQIGFSKDIVADIANPCGDEIATAQIIKTATQFSAVKKVEIK